MAKTGDRVLLRTLGEAYVQQCTAIADDDDDEHDTWPYLHETGGRSNQQFPESLHNFSVYQKGVLIFNTA